VCKIVLHSSSIKMSIHGIIKYMTTLIREKTKLDCSAVNIVYKSKNGLYRGFVQPYDITYEDETKEKVLSVLKDMTVQYENGLKRYNNPSHLATVPLSDEEDREKWNDISPSLMQQLVTKHFSVSTPDYYAEAKLPA